MLPARAARRTTLPPRPRRPSAIAGGLGEAADTGRADGADALQQGAADVVQRHERERDRENEHDHADQREQLYRERGLPMPSWRPLERFAELWATTPGLGPSWSAWQ